MGSHFQKSSRSWGIKGLFLRRDRGRRTIDDTQADIALLPKLVLTAVIFVFEPKLTESVVERATVGSPKDPYEWKILMVRSLVNWSLGTFRIPMIINLTPNYSCRYVLWILLQEYINKWMFRGVAPKFYKGSLGTTGPFALGLCFRTRIFVCTYP